MTGALPADRHPKATAGSSIPLPIAQKTFWL
jgi:hypothetical protein